MRRMGIGIVCVLCMLLVGCAAGKNRLKLHQPLRQEKLQFKEKQ